MKPISNSVVKEGFRQINELEARTKEGQIRQRVLSDTRQIEDLKDLNGVVLGAAAAMIWILTIAVKGPWGILLGLVTMIIGAAVLEAVYIVYKSIANRKKETLRQTIRDQAEAEIRRLYEEANKKTEEQIRAYDDEVKLYVGKVMKNARTIEPMIAYNVAMFNRWISHSDTGSNKKFVEAAFTYHVKNKGIEYIFQSGYANPQDSFIFDKQRFRDLSKVSECEGLAQVLAKLTISQMKAQYPPQTTIGVSHIDARVTLYFKAPNRNYIAPRDII